MNKRQHYVNESRGELLQRVCAAVQLDSNRGRGRSVKTGVFLTLGCTVTFISCPPCPVRINHYLIRTNWAAPWWPLSVHGVHSPTMSLSVSGSCLKSFLKSSLRCLYVGLSTCSDRHGQKHSTHTSKTHTLHALWLTLARVVFVTQSKLFVSMRTWDNLVKTTHRFDQDVGFTLIILWISFCGGFWQALEMDV